jgi:hypothetical protein
VDKIILKFLYLLGFSLLPTLFIKPNHIKDWLISYLLNSFLVTFFDTIVVKKNKLSYPIRLFPKYFKTSALYDYLLCPLVCVV